MSTINSYSEYFERLKSALDNVDTESIEKVVNILLKCRDDQGTMYIFGNGGSAANASHIAGDFLKGISFGMEKRFKTHCLNDNVAGTSAITNDLSFDEVFIEQLKTYLSPGDVVIGISGSGNSENIVRAIRWARENKATTVGLTGYLGGRLKETAEVNIHIPIKDMEITEDLHTVIFHAIKQEINRRIKGEQYSMGQAYDERTK
ncbi:MAG: SIS domain-containing protein [Bacteroidales bacterium]|nr:SIS domain-containing protein [Bacteroidales bacterium]